MLNRPKLKEAKSWKSLLSLANEKSYLDIQSLFDKDSKRGLDFSLDMNDLYFDFSRQAITREIFKNLLDLASEVNLEGSLSDMNTGSNINFTEDRPALHTVLRNPNSQAFFLNDKDISIDIKRDFRRIKLISLDLYNGRLLGYTGKPITDIINIGIGGSDLGVRMGLDALAAYKKEGLNFHFISNLDGVELNSVISKVDPSSSIFIVCSKSFSTIETLNNANAIKEWFISNMNKDAVKDHFFGVSQNVSAMDIFGIAKEKQFKIFEWIGGRYSITSSASLAFILAIGWDNFRDFLDGAYAMDRHFFEASFNKNIPVLLALIGIWNRNFLNISTHAVLPYDTYLKELPKFLQQLEMESNGKSTRKDNSSVDYSTSPVVWGDLASNGQHSFFQLLHQGTDQVSLDFILPVQSKVSRQDQHDLVISNCLAQSTAFCMDNSSVISNNDFNKFKKSVRPNSLILYNSITPSVLGCLVALYEHKVFTQGAIWEINSFDQWGVVLGKKLAEEFQSMINTENNDSGYSCIDHLLREIHLRKLNIRD
tara:strand:- start:11011 stop:12624 length:1614 start_codon:yes stop_codon:yes gene_type:complete